MAGGIDSIKKVQAAEERAKGIVEHAARKRDAEVAKAEEGAIILTFSIGSVLNIYTLGSIRKLSPLPSGLRQWRAASGRA